MFELVSLVFVLGWVVVCVGIKVVKWVRFWNFWHQRRITWETPKAISLSLARMETYVKNIAAAWKENVAVWMAKGRDCAHYGKNPTLGIDKLAARGLEMVLAGRGETPWPQGT